MSISFGSIYRDRVTGFTGVATGKATYISGCSQVLVAPMVGTDGAFREGQWFDEQRLELVDDVNRIVLDNGSTPGSDVPAPIR